MKAAAAVRDTVKDYSGARQKWDTAGLEVAVPELVARLSEALREEFEERAAILEFDAGVPRAAAERRAYRIIRQAQQVEVLLKEGEPCER